MRFRRIYWVTEQFDDSGFSEVTGVYTSVPNLLESGLGVKDYSSKKAGFKLSLCELDNESPPLFTVSSPKFEGLREHLAPLMESGELSHDEVSRLLSAIELYK